VREVKQAFNPICTDNNSCIISQEIMVVARQQKIYLVIVAPFRGIITKQNINAGALGGKKLSI